MPASKVTWVRSDGFSKNIASTRPSKRLRPLAGRVQALELARALQQRQQLLGGPIGQ